VARWVALLAAGALLLAGRFDWQEAGGRYARDAFASSLYFFCLLVPLSYHLTRRLSGRPWPARAACAITFVVGCLPYHWLGLSRFRHVVSWDPPGPVAPTPASLPGGLAEPGSPAERPLLLGLLLLFTVAMVLTADGPDAKTRLRHRAPIIAALAVIVVQVLLHTSLRSPYTYETLLEVPGKQYHVFLLPASKGAVNADVGLFTALDEHFNGIPRPMATMLIRRTFVHYLASHASYFFNPFYVYLVLNALVWLAAVAAGYDYARIVSGSADVAWLFAGLVLTGNGFIHFVAQPMSYLAGYAVVLFALCFYERLMVGGGDGAAVLLYGIVLGLGAATYDLFPLYPMLLLYAVFRGASLGRTAAAIALALLVPAGFVFLQHSVLKLPVDASNSRYLGDAAHGIVALLTAGTPALLYERTARLLIVYVQDLVYAFAVVGFVAALAGMALAADRRARVWFVLLLLPSLISTAFLYYGGVRWGRVPFAALPRLAYSAYPAVALGAALAFDGARRALARTPLAPVAPLLPWAAVLAFFAYHNSDVFGFTAPAYHFYWPTPIGCDPYAAPSCGEVP
jgi:hypothetical protein